MNSQTQHTTHLLLVGRSLQCLAAAKAALRPLGMSENQREEVYANARRFLHIAETWPDAPFLEAGHVRTLREAARAWIETPAASSTQYRVLWGALDACQQDADNQWTHWWYASGGR